MEIPTLNCFFQIIFISQTHDNFSKLSLPIQSLFYRPTFPTIVTSLIGTYLICHTSTHRNMKSTGSYTYLILILFTLQCSYIIVYFLRLLFSPSQRVIESHSTRSTLRDSIASNSQNCRHIVIFILQVLYLLLKFLIYSSITRVHLRLLQAISLILSTYIKIYSSISMQLLFAELFCSHLLSRYYILQSNYNTRHFPQFILLVVRHLYQNQQNLSPQHAYYYNFHNIHYNIILRPHISHHTQVRVSRNEIHLQHIHYFTLHYITIITPTWSYYSNNKSSHQVLYNPHLLYNYFKQYIYNINTHSDLLVNKHLTGEIPSTFPQRLIRTYHLAQLQCCQENKIVQE